MVNIWNYVGAENVRIRSIGGKQFEGTIICVDDVEELDAAEEDEIVIETAQGTIVGLKQSEVVQIERLN